MIDYSKLTDVFATLDTLDDTALCGVVAHAQKLLLDRPVSREQTPSLTVEVITDEEGRLLSVYRSLRPDMRRAHATAMP